MDNQKSSANLEELMPIPDNERSMSLWSYIPTWWAAMIVVMIFAVGFFAVHPHGPLNVTQAIVSLSLAALVCGVLFALNAFPGYREGIPYTVQLRSSFGINGAKIPGIVRAIPAIFWLGIATWAGGMAINVITNTLWGFGNVWVYFILFLIFNVYLALGGIKTMKVFNTVVGVLLVIMMTITLVLILVKGDLEMYEAFVFEGDWFGYGFWSVFAAGGACIITAALNVSDMSRHLIKSEGDKNNWLGHIIGIAPSYFYMLLLGIYYGMATGSADPVEAMMELSPSIGMGVAMLIFVLGAQTSSNLTLNILASAHGIQGLSPKKITWKTGVIISAVVCVFTFPWILFTSQNYYLFMGIYSCFLGPILGITLADYWIIHKQEIDIKELYNEQKGGRYWFNSGVSIAAYIAFLLGGIVSLFFVNISWMVGLPISFILYIILKIVIGMDKISKN
jgi:nucleobase:cation symporter-1, NCS1 family